MNIQENVPLAQHTTFRIGGPARFFCSVSKEEELREAMRFALERALPVFVLGGGSNILVSDKGFSGLVIKIELLGISFDGERVTAAAGEMWDPFVEKVVSRGLYGVENLSAIPGTVGAAPVQNIGAYGADLSQTVESVRALDTSTLKFVDLTNADCDFHYRDSFFKHQKGRYIITAVTLKLSHDGKVNIKYRDLQEYFASRKISSPTLEEVRLAVIDIRWNKLPDWKLWGTAGSFFKNPVISSEQYAELVKKYPGIPGFPESDGRVKVPLGWILDKVCDVKGLCRGHVCTYEKQALVLVAQPGATSAEVVELSNELMKRVKEKTGIEIEGEVEWVN